MQTTNYKSFNDLAFSFVRKNYRITITNQAIPLFNLKGYTSQIMESYEKRRKQKLGKFHDNNLKDNQSVPILTFRKCSDVLSEEFMMEHSINRDNEVAITSGEDYDPRDFNFEGFVASCK